MLYAEIKKNLPAFLFFFIGFGLYALTKGQEQQADFLNYHFYNGYAFLYNRIGYDYAPAGIQTYFNPLLDAFNYLFVVHFNDPRLLRFVLGAFGGINGFFLFKISQILFQKQTLKIWLATIIGITGTVVLSQMGSVMNDTQSALFIIIAVYCILSAFKNLNRALSLFIVAGFFLGVGAALKLTNGVYFIAAFVGVAVYLLTEKKGISSLCVFVFGFALGFIIFEGWWAWKLYHEFGNPFFPYYNNVFHSPDYLFESVRDGRFGVHTLKQALTLPFILTHKTTMVVAEPRMRDWRLAVLFVLGGLILLKLIYMFCRGRLEKRNPSFIFLLIFAFVSYFIWVYQFGIYRYAIPVVLVSGPCIILMLDYLLRSRLVQSAVGVGLTILVVTTNIYPDFGNLKTLDHTFLTVKAPAIPNKALVVVGGWGQSFVIPFLNAHARFITSDFPSLDSDFRAKAMIAAQPAGLLYILVGPFREDDSLQRFYNFYHLEQANCQVIQTNAVQLWQKTNPMLPPFQICSLQKINPMQEK